MSLIAKHYESLPCQPHWDVSSNTFYNWKHFEKYGALDKWVIVINLISLYHQLWIHHPWIYCIDRIINWRLVTLEKETYFKNESLLWNAPSLKYFYFWYKSFVEKYLLLHCVCTFLYKFTILYDHRQRWRGINSGGR